MRWTRLKGITMLEACILLCIRIVDRAWNEYRTICCSREDAEELVGWVCWSED